MFGLKKTKKPSLSGKTYFKFRKKIERKNETQKKKSIFDELKIFSADEKKFLKKILTKSKKPGGGRAGEEFPKFRNGGNPAHVGPDRAPPPPRDAPEIPVVFKFDKILRRGNFEF